MFLRRRVRPGWHALTIAYFSLSQIIERSYPSPPPEQADTRPSTVHRTARCVSGGRRALLASARPLDASLVWRSSPARHRLARPHDFSPTPGSPVCPATVRHNDPFH